MRERSQCFNIFDILGHIFGPKKTSFLFLYLLFTEVWLVPSTILSYICSVRTYFVKYFSSISFQYLKTIFTIQYYTLSLMGSQFIFLKCDRLIQDLRPKRRQKWIPLFWVFESFTSNCSLIQETMTIIYNRNVAELVHYLIVL